MRKFDIIIAGASTTGSWFAKQMADRGFSVLVIEKQKRENVSRNYDIFHMGKKEMEKFGYPIPEKTDGDYAFEFVGGSAYSAYGNHPKPSYTEVVGMHKHDYILRLNDDAVKAGAEIIYDAPFSDFIFDDKGRIIGAKYTTADGEQEALASIVADCTGIPSAARTKLPNGYGVENFVISPRDMFYVILYYVKYPEGHEKVIHTDSYLQYKAWSAPQADPKGGILGVGANLSFEYAEEMFKEFQKNVPWCDYEVEHIEKGRTPYCRPPYSFVSDGFIAMGDAACLTKPNNGEGCTSALYQARIAVDVITDALRGGGYITKA
ncbi:MAG: NAD(P)/FAD-dependent oxidoreductase, partial [Ruminococcus sp.]|nr:NAD(P)/FAD-dependent oxidoreductase [Ruminococcus sp.]